MVPQELNRIPAINMNLTRLQYQALVKYQLEMREAVVVMILRQSTISQWAKL